MTKTEIREPYLLQRLKKPFKMEGASDMMKGLSEAFSFGGGQVRGGISKEAWELLSKIWRYDYMGSSEFEWGAVPKSLEAIVELRKENKLIKFELPVTAKIDVYSTTPTTTKTAEAIVYVVCDKDNADKISGFIKKLANKGEGAFRTKEMVCLADNICGSEHYKDMVGWHEIDNHYIFFTDKEMYDNFCQLFDLQ